LDAKEQIRLDGFDLVIIDVRLPGGEDGLSLARRAAETPVGVILISADHRLRDNMEQSGHAYLLKPFRLDELVALSIGVMTKMGVKCTPHTPKSEEVAHRQMRLEGLAV
jgi:DNA-binding response OmpR family regulator